MNYLEQKVLGLFKDGKKTSLDRREIANRLNLRGGERKLLTKVLQQLERQQLIGERKGRYFVKQQQNQVEGVYSQSDQGFGFIRFDSELEDLFVPARHRDSAMDGDRVVANVRLAMRDRRPYGQIIRVVERAHRQLIGQYQQQGRGHLVWPMERKLGGPIHIKPVAELLPGQVVEVEIERYATGEQQASGRVIEVLGDIDDPKVDIETVIRSHNLPHQFSPAALDEAGRISREIPAEALVGRQDLRTLALVTIDGETAKDFDDAVALRKEANGTYRLWVSIADVAHYVTPGSALDDDALERGTSVYFPGFCLPMLPEQLSNGICSLRPGEDRLVMTAEMVFTDQGALQTADFYPAVMRSRARLTYTQVAACLDSPDLSTLPTDLTRQLAEMAELAKILTQMRIERGSLDLDIPEVEVLVDEQGKPVDLVKIERNQAHRLIEEFMLAANEAVAAFLRDGGWEFLYRIHERPELEKLQELQQLAAETGIGLVVGKKNLHQQLQNLLAEVADLPEARLINQQLLRSLQQACYAAHNSGHFGLAADCYCHFTSPIRRYPDLTVHRVLKLALAKRPHSENLPLAKLEALGKDCSLKERRAMLAERDLVDLRRCQLMAGHVGEEYNGIISSVTEFGFFVELDNLFVEGLVHIRSLNNDYYHFEPGHLALIGERRRQEFRIGMAVRVKVAKVELWRRRIDFNLIQVLDS